MGKIVFRRTTSSAGPTRPASQFFGLSLYYHWQGPAPQARRNSVLWQQIGTAGAPMWQCRGSDGHGRAQADTDHTASCTSIIQLPVVQVQKGGGSPQVLLPRLFGNWQRPTSYWAARPPPVGFELATNGIQFYAIANLVQTSLTTQDWEVNRLSVWKPCTTRDTSNLRFAVSCQCEPHESARGWASWWTWIIHAPFKFKVLGPQYLNSR